MSVKETMVTSLKTGDLMPVRFGYGPFEKKDVDFISAKNPPYLFMAIIEQGREKRIVLGDTKRHQEFGQAIMEDIGRLDSWVYGQVLMKDGLVKRVDLHHTDGSHIDDKQTERTILSIFNAFSVECLNSGLRGVEFHYAARAGDSFLYLPLSERVVKNPFRLF
jgi:hypothetical protein